MTRTFNAPKNRNMFGVPNFSEKICTSGPSATPPIAAPHRAMPVTRASLRRKYLVNITNDGNNPKLVPVPQHRPYVKYKGIRLRANDDDARPIADSSPPKITTLRHPRRSARNVPTGANKYIMLDEEPVTQAEEKDNVFSLIYVNLKNFKFLDFCLYN